MTLHIIPNLAQGSPEWHDARRGLITASAVGKMLTNERPDPMEFRCSDCGAIAGINCMNLRTSKPIKTLHGSRLEQASAAETVLKVASNDVSRGLIAQLVAERITGYTEPSFMNDDMARGVMHEPIARDKYAEVNGVTVTEVGFLVRDDWGYRIGASPDGLIGENGGLEIKCPRAKTHIRTIVADQVPAHYMAQVQACLLVSGREWWDFVSFCAGLPMWTKRVHADPKWHAVIVDAAAAFEEAAAALTSDYLTSAASLPTTEAVDHNDIGLVF